MTNRKRRDPIFAAAVLKLTFQSRKAEQSPQFQEIYQGVLRDLGITDEQVDVYLQEHRSEVEAAIRAKGRGASGSDRLRESAADSERDDEDETEGTDEEQD